MTLTVEWDAASIDVTAKNSDGALSQVSCANSASYGAGPLQLGTGYVAAATYFADLQTYGAIVPSSAPTPLPTPPLPSDEEADEEASNLMIGDIVVGGTVGTMFVAGAVAFLFQKSKKKTPAPAEDKLGVQARSIHIHMHAPTAEEPRSSVSVEPHLSLSRFGETADHPVHVRANPMRGAGAETKNHDKGGHPSCSDV